MIRHAMGLAVIGVTLITGSFAFAQEDTEAETPAPESTLPATPNMVTPAAQQATPQAPNVNSGAAGFFPSLPPSRPCEQQDINGLWKLTQVYENPIGKEMESFSTQPYQYIMFNRDSAFGDYRSAYHERGSVIMQKLRTPSGDMTQYVFNQGFLFYYKNSVASGSEACFIVANRSDPFQIGQMLLLPPADQTAVTGRRVKVFEKVQRGAGVNDRKANNHHKNNGGVKRRQRKQRN